MDIFIVKQDTTGLDDGPYFTTAIVVNKNSQAATEAVLNLINGWNERAVNDGELEWHFDIERTTATRIGACDLSKTDLTNLALAREAGGYVLTCGHGRPRDE